ncbi:YIEGIA domain-containing protein [Tumebacillus sp. ITR2]|uniref:YIEGIA domain-containing protein n=1 Tax=Tumebacillus amylolyticus TaxID=2801339 RepID=A0ABS1JBN7_9BACL|nr:YIEGIA domain-containing protein [Tumebacillus amylolyticus]MBL0387659.1 YIEGIA domain-containing protein [Tumebacillus amylolyticus]
MAQALLSPEYLTMIATGFVVGTAARMSTIKEDTRQYPSYPNGKFINVITGAVAATIGAVFPITLITQNFVGVSFLMLAVQQFRDVRKTERESLKDLEQSEYTPRGAAYIDGIAKTFESRNYLSLVASLLCVLTMMLIPGHQYVLEIPAGALLAFLVVYLLRRYTKGKNIGDFADIKLATLSFEGSMLHVDDIPVANVGLPEAQDLLKQEGLAVMITPRTVGASIALAHYGQRQTIIHEASRTFGLKRYLYMRRDFHNGRFCFAFVPIRRDAGSLLELVAEVPLLESTRKSERLSNQNVLPDQGGD